MTDTTLKNYSIIEKLVENHFGLDDNSIKIFKETLYNPFVDEVFKDVNADLRIKIPIGKEDLSFMDKGWEFFKSYFKIFVEENEITYENFNSNLFKKDKSKLRLFKNLKEYMLTSFPLKNKAIKLFCEKVNFLKDDPVSEFNKKLDIILNRIGAMKMPSSINLKIVFSLNFADWFLCSTGESWTSCLNLSSNYDSCYWTGLPGTIVDKNRVLLYVTDETAKEYRGITAEKIISRTWALLDTESNLHWLRFYPSDIVNSNNIKIILKGTPFADIKSAESSKKFRSKYSIDLLKYSSGITSFIFQDRSSFVKNGDNVFITNKGNGFCGFENNVLIDENNIECGSTLDELVSSNKNISEFFEKTFLCGSCGERFTESNIYRAEDDFYCEECFFDKFFVCEYCGETFKVDTQNNEHCLCGSCYKEQFATCSKCGEEIERATSKLKNHYICDSCGTKNS